MIAFAETKWILLTDSMILKALSWESITIQENQKEFKDGSEVKASACNAGDLGLIPGSGRSPGEGMATHSGILDWRILWTEEPGGLQFMRLQESDMT